MPSWAGIKRLSTRRNGMGSSSKEKKEKPRADWDTNSIVARTTGILSAVVAVGFFVRWLRR